MILNYKNTLEYRILRSHLRQYYIDKVKTPLRIAVERFCDSGFFIRVLLIIEVLRLAKKYPDVTAGNATRDSARCLSIATDNFLRKLTNRGRKPVFYAVLKVIRVEAEHDSWYDFMFDRFLEEFQNTGYKPKPYIKSGRPYSDWDKDA